MEEKQNKVSQYFDERGEYFDATYEKRRLSDFFRKSVEVRFIRTIERMGNLEEKTVLDVGCGTGRYIAEFVALNAKRITGIDISPDMIRQAKNRLGENNPRCTLLCGEFLDLRFDEKFDFGVAMGFFDYTANTIAYLGKMRELTREKIFASFPVRDFLWPQRKFRYWLKNCPIYSYRKCEIENILAQAGFAKFNIEKIHRDYFVEAIP